VPTLEVVWRGKVRPVVEADRWGRGAARVAWLGMEREGVRPVVGWSWEGVPLGVDVPPFVSGIGFADGRGII
jgi:hypothetical protein